MKDDVEKIEPATVRKINIVKAAVGYSLPRHAFSNGSLATALGLTVETISRKKNENGKFRMTPGDWARFFDHAALAGYDLGPSVLEKSPEELESALREAGVGIYGDATIDRHLNTLFELAGGANPNIVATPIAIERLPVARRGGIGGEVEPQVDTFLQTGDRVRLHLTCPGKGTLVVINSGPRRDLTCLLPSSFQVSTDAPGGPQTIPNTPDCDNFPVSPPEGDYRVFALWFKSRPNLALLRKNQPALHEVTARDLSEISREITVRAEAPGAVMVASKDYEVREN